MSPVHSASLIDASHHPKEILELIDLNVDRALVDYLVQETAAAVDHAIGLPASDSCLQRNPEFTEFVARVLCRAQVRMCTTLVTLVYTHRAHHQLSIQNEEFALERVFLGALITASKYTNDASLRNPKWSEATRRFGKNDINRIEREFLDVLDWRLGISESDILDLHEPIMRLQEPIVQLHKPTLQFPPLRRFARSPKRLIPSARAIFALQGSDSDTSTSPPSSPAPSTPSSYRSSPPRHPGFTKSKSIKDIAAQVSNTISPPWVVGSDPKPRSVSPRPNLVSS